MLRYGSCLFIWCLILVVWGGRAGTVHAQTHVDSSDVARQLNDFFQAANTNLYILLRISKEIESDFSSASAVERYRLLQTTCTTYEEIDPLVESFEVFLDSDQSFQKLRESPPYFLLEAGDQRFWVNSNCVQKDLSVQPNLLSANELAFLKARAIERADQIIDRQERLYRSYIRFLKDHKIPQEASSQYSPVIEGIEDKHYLARKIHARINRRNNLTSAASIPIAQRFQVNGQIAVGSSSFNQEFVIGNPLSTSSGNTDLDLQGNYLVNSQSKINFGVSNRSVTELSSTNTWNSHLGYETKINDIQYSAGVNYQSFDNSSRQEVRSGRTQVFGQVRKATRDGYNFNVRYQLVNHDYKLQAINSYTQHRANGEVTFPSLTNSQLKLSTDLVHAVSDADALAYTDFRPSLQWIHKGARQQSNLSLSASLSSFPQAEIRSNQRFILRYRTSQSLDGRQKSNNFAAVYRNFNNNPDINYADVLYDRTSSRYSVGSTLFRFATHVRYFPNLVEQSYIDIRHGGETGRGFYMSYDVNLRKYYPSDVSSLARLDGYFKMGLSVKGIRIGPTLGWHVYHDFEAQDEFTLRSDKNAFQYGVESSGSFLIEKRVTCRYRASYDFNTIYNQSLSPGDPEPIAERNPSNLQFSLDLGYKVYQRKGEIFARASYFNHKTGFPDDVISTSILEANDGLKLLVGVRFRYN